MGLGIVCVSGMGSRRDPKILNVMQGFHKILKVWIHFYF